MQATEEAPARNEKKHEEDVVQLARTLIDIESITGNEKNIALWISDWLQHRGALSHPPPFSQKEDNVYACVASLCTP